MSKNMFLSENNTVKFCYHSFVYMVETDMTKL